MKTKFFLFLLLVAATQMKANNMLVKNVTTTGNNATNKTIQVQFDMSWDNSWRDGINWDAAWVFMKYKDASGNWQHVKLNTTGFANGTGTANIIQVGSDKVGAFVYRSAAGTGTFASTTMQMQWNYGLSGLTNVTGLEVRVFAVEMVYVPEGDYNSPPKGPYYAWTYFDYSSGANNGATGQFLAPGNNGPVINTHLTPTLYYSDGSGSSSLKIKGDVGIDFNNDGVVDNTTYPTGYKAFYCYKYELSEQQYADFLNTLTSTQKSNLGIAGTGISLTNGQYFSSTPNKACGNSNSNRVLAYADWSGLRPMTFTEFNKSSYGPFQPYYRHPYFPAWSSEGGPDFNFEPYRSGIVDVSYSTSSTSTRASAGSSYYGIMFLSGNCIEPIVSLTFMQFNNSNGNGTILSNGYSDVSTWNVSSIRFIDAYGSSYGGNLTGSSRFGFRYVRSAE
jgi:hypothetical protein